MNPTGSLGSHLDLPRLQALSWAGLAWLVLAALELAPAWMSWDAVTMHASRVSVQHIVCSIALGSWVGLHTLAVRQKMARVPAVAPPWRNALAALTVATVPFTLLALALPWISTGLASLQHGHAHAAGPLAPAEIDLVAACLAWTLGGGWWWIRAFPKRIGLGGPLLLAGGWLLSPHASGGSIGCAAGLVWLAALLWPARPAAAD
jgi:hypothetical protein